jgi:hypothetical protein
MDCVEVLSARFVRTVDFFVHKFLRAADRHELIAEGTLIDTINRAEKRCGGG